MFFFQEKQTIRQIINTVLGNLATSLWFLPFLAKWFHSIRGVHFSDACSVFIGRHVIIDNKIPHLISIGSDVWLTANTIVLSHSHSSRFQREKYGLEELIGPVTIEEGVFIGVGSIILPETSLGKGCYVAAGSVVRGVYPEGNLIAGNPAKIIKRYPPLN